MNPILKALLWSLAINVFLVAALVWATRRYRLGIAAETCIGVLAGFASFQVCLWWITR